MTPMGEGSSHDDEHVVDPHSGVLRASVFGVSDGLVSNLALVMGVAGGTGDPAIVVVAGVAGLLAGAFSMGAGEYVSMQTQREMLESELEVERRHIVAYPEEEEAHLAVLLSESGLSRDDARRIAAKIHETVEPAVGFHALFELGIHPRSLGAPVSAALSSFVAFGVGASVPLAPWLVTSDGLTPTLVLSSVGLLAVGGAATRLTRQNAWFGAFRQLLVGVLPNSVRRED